MLHTRLKGRSSNRLVDEINAKHVPLVSSRTRLKASEFEYVPIRIFLRQHLIQALSLVVDSTIAANRLEEVDLLLGAAGADNGATFEFGKLYCELSSASSSGSHLKTLT